MKHHPLPALLLGISLLATPASADPVQFESAQIHPLDVRGNLAAVVNTPDARVSIFELNAGQEPTLVKEIRVGLEPVTARWYDNSILWVVNHLSDDISIVEMSTGAVWHSLDVGDEPTDVVFVDHPLLDDGSRLAVVCVSQEDKIKVYNPLPPFELYGEVDVPGADPRALVVAPGGRSVWAAVFESGNNTTLARRDLVHDPSGPYGGGVPPFTPPPNPNLPPELFPDNGLIVKQEQGQWVDEMGGDWTSLIPYGLRDADLVRIDLGVGVSVGKTLHGVGTLLSDLTVDPITGELFVVGIESFNEILFEPKLKGDFARNLMMKVDPGLGAVLPFSLNPHVNFDLQPAPISERRLSVAGPTEVLLSDLSGAPELYVSGIGGRRIAVLDPGSGSVMRRLNVPEGVTGLGEWRSEGLLLALDRFTNRLHVIDPQTGDTGRSVGIGRSDWDPTPQDIREGRRFLYSGENSAHGNLACATCHPDGNMDALAWDLGDPTSGELVQLPPEKNGGLEVAPFHPFKGPMVTQSLRGMKDTGRLHWRGDREDFLAFNGAFASLLGGEELSAGDMQLFEAFMLSVQYPPNPFRSPSDATHVMPNGGDPALGELVFSNNGFCTNCHAMPLGTTTQVFPIELLQGFGNQPIKIPQLRNLYEKQGFDDFTGNENKRAFGFLHDGDDENLSVFVAEPVFNLDPISQMHLEAFLMTFPTGTHPATGVQVTVPLPDIGGVATAQAQELEAQALAGNIDLIAHLRLGGEVRGFHFVNGGYQSDRRKEFYAPGDVIDMTIDSPVTFLAVPVGEGIRMGIDRDLDGFLDQDELDLGTDPANPDDTPTAIDDDAAIGTQLARVTGIFPAPFQSRTSVQFYLGVQAPAEVGVYDLRGRKVRTLASGVQTAGAHTIVWDARDDHGANVASGAYFVRLKTDRETDTRKVVLMR